MKRLFFAVAIVLILAGIISWGTYYVNQANLVINEYIDKIETAANEDNIDQAVELCDQAERAWVGFEKKLNIFVNHAEICEIGVGISSIKPLIEYDEKAEFFSAVNELKVMLTHFASMEKCGS